ncbi:MAG: hypothetical protein UR51_C0020G0004 [Candidatus Moranbacteria bacterium GW2011_GWF1_34_10]|nr:MAG: hypothetical protein UR51_C0020G0004 [Candidatus Moranbacteria bacterium GW2011_GWF1_34_10]
MAMIRIIAVPDGKQPKCEREKLVRLILPISENAPKEKFTQGYPVDTDKVIKALEEKSWEEAQWWRKHIDPKKIRWIFFGEKFCQLI